MRLVSWITWLVSRITLPRLDIFVKIAALLVGTFGIWKYLDEVEVKRQGASLAMFEEMWQGRVLESREAIGKSLFDIINEAKRTQSPEDMRTFFNEAVNRALRGPLRMAYQTIIGYFERARLCVVSGQCDKDTMETLLKIEAEQQWRYLSPLLGGNIRSEAAADNPRFALGLRCFSGLGLGGEYGLVGVDKQKDDVCFGAP